MTGIRNPALEAFVAQIGSELVVAQVLIARTGHGFELRHVSDHSAPAKQLRAVKLGELRALGQITQDGAFRALKSAPSLQNGWRTSVRDADDLGIALNHLYPGAVAGWYAIRGGEPPVTNYRDFTNRQSGMYRITQLLSDQQVVGVIQACCRPESCLKRRLWSVDGLSADVAESKSIIPCLEPCAILLESARTTVRKEQAEKRQEFMLSQCEGC